VLYTASSFIRFYNELEDEVIGFYEKLLEDQRFSEYHDVFSSFIEESNWHKDLITRSYREVITDAMEAAFPLKSLDEEDYEVKTGSVNEQAVSDVLNDAIQVEGACRQFCLDACDSLSGLLADVPEEFTLVAEKKSLRIEKLKSL
jgi:hypothetical protein